jgi:hypothetical protein
MPDVTIEDDIRDVSRWDAIGVGPGTGEDDPELVPGRRSD